MFESLAIRFNAYSVDAERRRKKLGWWLMYLSLLGMGTLMALVMVLQGPSLTIIALTLVFLAILLILYQPRYGVYLILFFTLVGDGNLLHTYPFLKNLSSSESLLFINPQLLFSPLELMLVITITSFLLRPLARRKLQLRTGPLFWPVMLFMVFVVGGLIYGIASGGNINIALWEARAIFYLPALLVLVTNLVDKREHLNNLLWVALLAIFVEGIIGSIYFIVVLGGNISTIDRLTEHSASIHANTLFLMILAAWLLRGSSWTKRLVLPVMAAPVFLTYLVSQRRAAFLTLGISVFLLILFLYKARRRLFWVVMPILSVGALAYLVAFWNVNSSLGLPAQAVKSVISPQSVSVADQRSNIYRQIENYNILYTIRQSPLTGVGFGNKFYSVIPLPQISFIWREYITHNSIAWIWMKTGVAGFVTMLYMFATSIMVGVRTVWRTRQTNDVIIAIVATLYVVMHAIYAYVDMSWDSQSMVYVGICLGIINSIERILARGATVEPPRWSWQTPSRPDPLLAPLPAAKNAAEQGS